jgi:hypothetical protein
MTNHCILGWAYQESLKNQPPPKRGVREWLRVWWLDVQYGWDSYRQARRGEWE